MRQAIVDAPGKNGTSVFLNDDVKTAREIAGDSRIASDQRPFAQKTMRLLTARRPAAPLWIAAAFVAATWAPETQGFPEAGRAQADALASAQRTAAVRNVDFRGTTGDLDLETRRASRSGGKSVQFAQATTLDTEELQKALEQEHSRADLLARELTIARHLEMLLTLHKARAESAGFRRVSESEYAELRKSLQQERDRLTKMTESGAAELCKSLQGDRADRLEQDLAAAKRDVEAQKALAAKASDEATRLSQAAESDTVELRKSLQQEQERAGRLEHELGAARRDVETQTALAAKASDDATQLKQAAESDAAELRKSLQQERERAGRLEEDLAAARRDVETQTALAAKASDDATQLKQAAESDAAELRKSLQQERERAGALEEDLAAARRDVKAQEVLAAKATDDATQLKRAAEGSFAELKRSLQKEHDGAEALAQDLSMARTQIYAYDAQARQASDKATDLKQAAESAAVELQKSLQQERERAEHLQQGLEAAKHDVEIQTALAAKASDEASQLKQVAENGSAELKRSLRKEQDRAEALAQDLSMARAKIYAYETQARGASNQATESGAAELRKSLQQEQEKRERLEQDLAAARRDVETQTASAAKANEEAAQRKRFAEHDSAVLKQSLQKEHDRAEALAQVLSMVAQARKSSDQGIGLKQAAESGAAELRKSLVQERERAARLQQDLMAARHEVEIQAARAAKASIEAIQLKQVSDSGTAELRKSLQQEQEKRLRSEQDLAAARRDLETQTALTAKAGAEAARVMQVADRGFAALVKSLHKEHDKAARLERELTSERNKKDAPAAAATAGQVTRHTKLEAETTQPGTAEDRVTVPEAEGAAEPNPGDAAEVARLVARANVLLGRGDIDSARIVLERAADRGSVRASFALAETYDPLVLSKWGTHGARGDATKARDLYAKAQAGGIEEAKERLDALRR
jgi:hypothetical protein